MVDMMDMLILTVREKLDQKTGTKAEFALRLVEKVPYVGSFWVHFDLRKQILLCH